MEIKKGLRAIAKSYDIMIGSTMTALGIWALAYQGIRWFGFILLGFFINFLWFKLEDINKIMCENSSHNIKLYEKEKENDIKR